jgi:hypothetical protein
MKRLFVMLGLLVLTAGILFTGFRVMADDMAHRLQGKTAQAQAGVRSWAQEGCDPSAVLVIMQQVKPALDAGDPHKAEALLDRALKMLSDDETGRSLGKVIPEIANRCGLPKDVVVTVGSAARSR